jgi:2,3,4,5-tetrahydropyridine-2-carboxylate N-succinyltransferase
MDLQPFYEREPEALLADARLPAAHEALLVALEAGEVRAATPDGSNGWTVHAWVKRAILLGFRAAPIERVDWPSGPFFDKTAYPPRRFERESGVRLVPGGTAVRRGSFVAPGVVVMPPAYVNVGAHVGEGSMIDSHALVGSCSQIGRRVHLSCGVQIGGVLEPAGARPVIVEDDVFVGGLVGLFEGVLVRKRAVIASGVIVTRATVIYDLVQEREWRQEIPEGAVVVQGSRPAKGAFAQQNGVHLSTPVIVKYRDASTEAATALEGALR